MVVDNANDVGGEGLFSGFEFVVVSENDFVVGLGGEVGEEVDVVWWVRSKS